MSGESTRRDSPAAPEALDRAFGPRATCNRCGRVAADYRVIARFLHDLASVRAYCGPCYADALEGRHDAAGDGLLIGWAEFAARFGAPGPPPPPATAGRPPAGRAARARRPAHALIRRPSVWPAVAGRRLTASRSSWILGAGAPARATFELDAGGAVLSAIARCPPRSPPCARRPDRSRRSPPARSRSRRRRATGVASPPVKRMLSSPTNTLTCWRTSPCSVTHAVAHAGMDRPQRGRAPRRRWPATASRRTRLRPPVNVAQVAGDVEHTPPALSAAAARRAATCRAALRATAPSPVRGGLASTRASRLRVAAGSPPAAARLRGIADHRRLHAHDRAAGRRAISVQLAPPSARAPQLAAARAEVDAGRVQACRRPSRRAARSRARPSAAGRASAAPTSAPASRVR